MNHNDLLKIFKMIQLIILFLMIYAAIRMVILGVEINNYNQSKSKFNYPESPNKSIKKGATTY